MQPACCEVSSLARVSCQRCFGIRVPSAVVRPARSRQHGRRSLCVGSSDHRLPRPRPRTTRRRKGVGRYDENRRLGPVTIRRSGRRVAGRAGTFNRPAPSAVRSVRPLAQPRTALATPSPLLAVRLTLGWTAEVRITATRRTVRQNHVLLARAEGRSARGEKVRIYGA